MSYEFSTYKTRQKIYLLQSRLEKKQSRLQSRLEKWYKPSKT